MEYTKETHLVKPNQIQTHLLAPFPFLFHVIKVFFFFSASKSTPIDFPGRFVFLIWDSRTIPQFFMVSSDSHS